MARRTVGAALLGQLLALIIALTAVCSASLAQQGLSAPTLQSSLNYLLLGIVYTTLHVRAVGWRLKCRWWAYALLALLDVEGNFCLVLAYRYTSLTSVTLLDSFTIPMVVLLSTALLGAAYRRGHYGGAAVCIAGLLLLVVSDRTAAGEAGDQPSNPLLGDGLVLLGATLYGLCNVLQEWLLGDVLVHELLGMLGIFGCLWSAAQGLPLELHTVLGAQWSAAAVLPFLGFGLSMFAFYSLVPYELKWGGAALLNISLLSSDLWAAAARYFYFGGFPGNSLLFFLASLLIVAAGILLFTLAGDVETKLGAGSDVAGSAALPVAYHRVPGAERRPLASLSNKGAQQALEEVHRQQVEQQGQQQQQRGGAAANPFDIAAGRRGGGAAAPGGFEPLPAAEESWPAETPAGDGSTASSPAALMVAAPPGTAEVGERLAKRSSLELELEESHR